ncbi:MAG: HAMP domain-containing protein [Solirubrobacterales bacterium]|nr:HAMP domain-containing protein [Solirubrobacterales bacterium]
MGTTRKRTSDAGRPSLARQAILANASVLALALVLLLVTPVTVSAPIRLVEIAVLIVGFGSLFAINLALVHRTLAPLRELAAQTRDIDLRDPERRLWGDPDQPSELATLTDAFNAMLDRLADERRAGARAALVAQERERLRIARALHDEAGQTLTAVALEIERGAGGDSPASPQRMAALAEQLHLTLAEIGRIARELRPEALDDLGLTNALIALTSRISRQGRLTVERRLSPELPTLSPELELVIYRVAQEALTNVLRHAEASRCTVALATRGELVELTVTDDGRGMPDQVAPDSTGLEGMRERAMLAGGGLTVESEPGGGTRVTLTIDPREAP